MWRAWLTYVYTKGGWRGKEIHWDPEEPLESSGYDERTRTKAEAEADEMIARIKSQILSRDSWALWQEGDSDEEEEGTAQEYPPRETY